MKTNSRVILVIGLVIVLIGVLLAGCSETHTTVAGALSGSPGDKVDCDVVRISPFFGGISKGDPYYAFVVYDKARDHIMVLVQRKDMTFEPEEMDFASIKGVLRASPVEGGEFPVVVYASEMRRATAPADWGE